ncbi:hypothetical protein [Gordonia malaquae]|uniref:hypothetical protein n=1 Tax=Gordonia malaquae TaxID=410332 RepID=UPI003019DAF0
MSTPIDIAAVRKAVDIANLKLDEPRDEELQAAVNAHFPVAFDAWAAGTTVDPYDGLREDGKDDVDSIAVPPQVTVDQTRAHDIVSAVAHTIREAIESVHNVDPCSSASDLVLA